MKGRTIYRWLGVLLAGILTFESVDMTALAVETETTTETVSGEQETGERTKSKAVERIVLEVSVDDILSNDRNEIKAAGVVMDDFNELRSG